MAMLHLKKQFPDVCKHVIDFKYVFSRSEVENKIVKFTEALGQKAMVYAQSGKRVVFYTSQIFTDKLKTMKKGDIVADIGSGRVGVISSDEPFFCGCSLCLRVDFADSSDVYECAYFM